MEILVETRNIGNNRRLCGSALGATDGSRFYLVFLLSSALAWFPTLRLGGWCWGLGCSVLSHLGVLKFWTETFWLISRGDRFLQDLSHDFLAEACKWSLFDGS